MSLNNPHDRHGVTRDPIGQKCRLSATGFLQIRFPGGHEKEAIGVVMGEQANCWYIRWPHRISNQLIGKSFIEIMWAPEENSTVNPESPDTRGEG
jgi:hypothetical protein